MVGGRFKTKGGVGPFQCICFGISWVTMWQGHVKIWVSRFGYDVQKKTVFLSSY